MTTGPYLSANGSRVVDLDLSIAYYGAPVCDLALATPVPLTGPVAVIVGNLSLVMAPLRQRTFAGQTYARLVGGAAGWQKPVSIGPYSNPAGALLSHVLGDLAMATGERVSLAAGLDRSLGAFYVPDNTGPAARTLAAVAGPLWWVDFAGVTQVASARPATTVNSPATIPDYDGGKGWVSVATEDPAAWVPGATYTSAVIPAGITVRATRIRSGNDGVLRVEALVA